VAATAAKATRPTTDAASGLHKLCRKTSPRPWLGPQIQRRREPINDMLWSILVALANGNQKWPLYLYGPPGRGKTCASLFLADQCPWVLYAPVERLVTWEVNRAELWWDAMRSTQLLIVDELARSDRSHGYQGLELDAVTRAADARDPFRPAIWISNHPPEFMLRYYDERVHSRICCGTVFELLGPDLRMR